MTVLLSLVDGRWCDFDLLRHDSSALCAADAVWFRKRMSAWSRYLHSWFALLHRVQAGLASSHYNDISMAAIAVTVNNGRKWVIDLVDVPSRGSVKGLEC